MASVDSPFRKLIKPILKKALGDNAYSWFLLYGKLRDIRCRLVEEPEMELLPRFLGPDDRVIDIGANYAYYTTRLAKLCYRGQVFAFEPIPSTYAICKKILSFLRIKNAQLFRLAVGKEAGRVHFEVPLQEIGTPSAGQAHMQGRDNSLPGSEAYYPFPRAQSIACDVIALDQPEWRQRLGKIGFIKIDIEGAEYFALQGMRELLRQEAPVVLLEICPYFLTGFGIQESQLRVLASELGYKFYRYEPAQKKLLLQEAAFTDGNYFLLPQQRIQNWRELLA